MLGLLASLKPKFFIYVTAGSGTNVALCHEYGVRVLGLDLKEGITSKPQKACGSSSQDLTPYLTLRVWSVYLMSLDPGS